MADEDRRRDVGYGDVLRGGEVEEAAAEHDPVRVCRVDVDRDVVVALPAEDVLRHQHWRGRRRGRGVGDAKEVRRHVGSRVRHGPDLRRRRRGGERAAQRLVGRAGGGAGRRRDANERGSRRRAHVAAIQARIGAVHHPHPDARRRAARHRRSPYHVAALAAVAVERRRLHQVPRCVQPTRGRTLEQADARGRDHRAAARLEHDLVDAAADEVGGLALPRVGLVGAAGCRACRMPIPPSECAGLAVDRRCSPRRCRPTPRRRFRCRPRLTVIALHALRCAGRVMPAVGVLASPASERQCAPPSPEYQTPPLADAAYRRSPCGCTASALMRPVTRGLPAAWPPSTVCGPSGIHRWVRELAGRAGAGCAARRGRFRGPAAGRSACAFGVEVEPPPRHEAAPCARIVVHACVGLGQAWPRRNGSRTRPHSWRRLGFGGATRIQPSRSFGRRRRAAARSAWRRGSRRCARWPACRARGSSGPCRTRDTFGSRTWPSVSRSVSTSTGPVRNDGAIAARPLPTQSRASASALRGRSPERERGLAGRVHQDRQRHRLADVQHQRVARRRCRRCTGGRSRSVVGMPRQFRRSRPSWPRLRPASVAVAAITLSTRRKCA